LPGTSDDVPTTLDSTGNEDSDSEVEIIDSPRFYKDDELYNEPLPVPMGIDDFTLDPRYTQYADAEPTTPDLTMMSSEDDTSQMMDFSPRDDAQARLREVVDGSHTWMAASYAQDVVPGIPEEKKQQEPEPMIDPMEEEFARIEAWFNSSAVEIVPGYRG